MHRWNVILLSAGGITFLLVTGFIIFVMSDYLLPDVETTEEEDSTNTRIGAKIARYLTNQVNSVLFTWSYNNSIINSNLSSLVGAYCDGALTYGTLANASSNNVSLVGVFGQKTGTMNTSALNTVVNKFILALEGVTTNSTLVTSWNDIEPWPPIFWWDIAFEDNSSLSILYSKDQNVITAINGTWEMSEYGLNESTTVDFPNFEYNWEDDYYRAFLELDTEGIQLILEAINIYLNQIANAIN